MWHHNNNIIIKASWLWWCFAFGADHSHVMEATSCSVKRAQFSCPFHSYFFTLKFLLFCSRSSWSVTLMNIMLMRMKFIFIFIACLLTTMSSFFVTVQFLCVAIFSLFASSNLLCIYNFYLLSFPIFPYAPSQPEQQREEKIFFLIKCHKNKRDGWILAFVGYNTDSTQGIRVEPQNKIYC